MSAPDAVGPRACSPEDEARADLYGLLARLWLAPPDDALIGEFARAAQADEPPGGALAAPWRGLVEAMCAVSRADLAEEHAALFEGVGKPEVLVCASYYLTGFLNERPLAALRDDLAALGLARDPARGETEDHVAFLFEVMRYLIVGDDGAVCTLKAQRQFHHARLRPWIDRLCDAVDAHPRARAWRAVSQVTRAFMQVEAQAFEWFEE